MNYGGKGGMRMTNKGLEVVKESIEVDLEDAEQEFETAKEFGWFKDDEAYDLGFKNGLQRALMHVDAAIRFENTEIKKATEGNQ